MGVLFEVTHSLNITVSVIRIFILFETYTDTLNAEIVFIYYLILAEIPSLIGFEVRQ